MLRIGEKAPDFSLADQNGVIKKFTDLRGDDFTVIFFYPKDETPGCTAQSCGFRDIYEDLKIKGVKIIGISKDPPDSHQRFADKYRLNYPLLSDVKGDVHKLFGVGKTFGIVPERVTFVVQKDNTIGLVYSSLMNVENHIEEVVRFIGK